MMHNHGVHGTQDLANVLVRAGVRFHYVTGHLREAAVLAALQDFGLAGAAVRRLRSARIGLLGHPFPGMGDFALDTTHLTASLGCSWVHLSVEDYVQRAALASATAVGGLVSEYLSRYAIAEDLTEADLASAARAELALRGLVTDQCLQAFTYQFLAFGEDERTATLPFVGASRLMAEGVGFGGEGDVISAVGTSLLGWLQPPATFSEVFTIDFEQNALFMSHMGEANVAMARRDRPARLVARPKPITRTRERQLALVMSLEPGPATFFALTLGPAQRWRLITAPARIPEFGPLADACVPHFKLQPAGDVRQFLTNYALAGGPHHNGVCFGDARSRLRLAAGMLGADYVELPA
jgi:L-arabinose isomerase